MHAAQIQRLMADIDAFFGTDHTAVYQKREYLLQWVYELKDADEDLVRRTMQRLKNQSTNEEGGIQVTLSRFMYELKKIDSSYGQKKYQPLPDCDICVNGWRKCLVAGDRLYSLKLVSSETGICKNALPGNDKGVYEHYRTVSQPCTCQKGTAVNTYFKYDRDMVERINKHCFRDDVELARHYKKLGINSMDFYLPSKLKGGE